jgi:hypothetical protein
MYVLFVYKLGFRQGHHVQTREGLPGVRLESVSGNGMLTGDMDR